jgi:hypothetical protein
MSKWSSATRTSRYLATCMSTERTGDVILSCIKIQLIRSKGSLVTCLITTYVLHQQADTLKNFLAAVLGQGFQLKVPAFTARKLSGPPMFTPKWDTLKPSDKNTAPPPSSDASTSHPQTPGSGQQGLVPTVNNPLETRRSLESLLNEPYLAVSRRIELANLLVGFEQANHYTLYNRHGQIVGYLAEDNSIAKTFIRNIARTHRPFSAAVFDPQGNVLLRIQRPFYWITSSLFVHTAHHEPIGEIHTNWHLWRRRYSLYSDRTQFASIDAPWLSWEFTLLDEQGRILVRYSVALQSSEETISWFLLNISTWESILEFSIECQSHHRVPLFSHDYRCQSSRMIIEQHPVMF